MGLTPPDPVPAAAAVGALLAPVVACLRGDDEGLGVLVDASCEDGAVTSILRAAPAVARVYLRLAPPPDGVDQIVDAYPDAAFSRFRDRTIVTLGADCLDVARAADVMGAHAGAVAEIVFVNEALSHGERHTLESVIASCWWCAYVSARLRDVDPIAEAAAICRYVARVA